MPLALRVHRQDAQPCRGRSVANDDAGEAGAGEAGIERQRPFRCLGDIAGCALETSAVSGEVKDGVDCEVGKTGKIMARHGA